MAGKAGMLASPPGGLGDPYGGGKAAMGGKGGPYGGGKAAAMGSAMPIHHNKGWPSHNPFAKGSM